MPGRYLPTLTPDQTKWVILDMETWGYCTLPDDDDPSSLLPLEWDSRAAAEGWLRNCYQQWFRWERNGGASASMVPPRWRPYTPTLNPPVPNEPPATRDPRWL